MILFFRRQITHLPKLLNAGILLFLCLIPVRAEGNAGIPFGSFHIKQESMTRNGVWVARPCAIDERIASLLRTNRIKNLESYSHWLEKNISYKKNNGTGLWRNPQETLAQGYGDCKNFTFLTEAVLRVAGYLPLVMVCFTREGGHAFCVFQADGFFYWFNNAVLEKTTATSLLDFEQEMITKYNFLSLLKLNTTDNRWEIVYRRS